MQTKLFNTKHAVLCAAACCAMFAGAAQAALQDRDLDGNGVTDAFYDTDLEITWLRDANVNREMTWEDAVSWVDSFTFGGYSDWRLPTSDTCVGAGCTGSEMGHLWLVELNKKPGDFQHFVEGAYWSGTEFDDPTAAWYFSFPSSQQSFAQKGNSLYALAVRPGDVPSVPDPETYALMLAGLAGLALASRRRRR